MKISLFIGSSSLVVESTIEFDIGVDVPLKF